MMKKHSLALLLLGVVVSVLVASDRRGVVLADPIADVGVPGQAAAGANLAGGGEGGGGVDEGHMLVKRNPPQQLSGSGDEPEYRSQSETGSGKLAKAGAATYLDKSPKKSSSGRIQERSMEVDRPAGGGKPGGPSGYTWGQIAAFGVVGYIVLALMILAVFVVADQMGFRWADPAAFGRAPGGGGEESSGATSRTGAPSTV